MTSTKIERETFWINFGVHLGNKNVLGNVTNAVQSN